MTSKREDIFDRIMGLPGLRILRPWYSKHKEVLLYLFFGGSGGIAIEALSRGASAAVIVEKNPKAARIIRENLEHTHLDDRAELLTTDASAAVTRLAGRESAAFDLIFLDPPYGLGLEDRALAQLLPTTLLQADTLLIVETDIEADPTRFEALGYSVLKVKEYKTNQHIFLQRRYDET